jgi:hypothetical protein
MKQKIIIISVFSLLIIFMVFLIYQINKKASGTEESLKKNLEILGKSYKDEVSKHKKAAFTRDSLFFVNNYLNKYRALIDATHVRDSVKLNLKYNVGDIVHIKRDSARAIVIDIIVGGSKHEYYVRYKLQFKDKSIEEVLPELIF